MALTLTYKVTGLRKRNQVNTDGETLQGAVVQTYWECHGVDENGDKAHFSGATPFTAVNVPAGDFKPFEQLTEADVIAWIKNVVDNDPTYKQHIEERIREQIDSTNIVDAPMPWAPTDVTPVPSAPLVDVVPEAADAEPVANSEPSEG